MTEQERVVMMRQQHRREQHKTSVARLFPNFSSGVETLKKIKQRSCSFRLIKHERPPRHHDWLDDNVDFDNKIMERCSGPEDRRQLGQVNKHG